MSEESGRTGAARESVREVLVVVSSILIAFALDAWWDGISEHRALVERIPAVVAEVEEAHRELVAAVEAHEIYADASAALAERLSAVAPGTSISVPDTLIGIMYSHFVMDVPTGVTERFITAGGLAVLRDEAVAAELNGWPRLMQDAVDDQRQLRFEVQTLLLPLVVRSGQLGRAAVVGRQSVRRMLRANAGDPVEPYSDPPETVAVRAAPELVNLLTWRSSVEAMRRDQMEVLAAEQERLAATLRARIRD